MSLAWSCTCWTSSSSDWALTMKPQSQFTCFAIFLRWAVRRKFLIRWLDSLEEFGQPGFTRAGPLKSRCFVLTIFPPVFLERLSILAECLKPQLQTDSSTHFRCAYLRRSG